MLCEQCSEDPFNTYMCNGHIIYVLIPIDNITQEDTMRTPMCEICCLSGCAYPQPNIQARIRLPLEHRFKVMVQALFEDWRP